MLGKILIVVGFLLIVLAGGLYVCAMPIFSFTRTETHTINLPPVQKFQSIMDYAFSLGGYETRKVSFDCTAEQTLNVALTIEQDGAIAFYIANQQPSGIEAIYLDKRVYGSLNTSWKPTQDGSYYLKFYRESWPSVYIHANVTKTWTVVDTRTDSVTVTEQRPLILDLDFMQASYIGSGVAILGGITIVVGGYLHYRPELRHGKDQSTRG